MNVTTSRFTTVSVTPSWQAHCVVSLQQYSRLLVTNCSSSFTATPIQLQPDFRLNMTQVSWDVWPSIPDVVEIVEKMYCHSWNGIKSKTTVKSHNLLMLAVNNKMKVQRENKNSGCWFVTREQWNRQPVTYRNLKVCRTLQRSRRCKILSPWWLPPHYEILTALFWNFAALRRKEKNSPRGEIVTASWKFFVSHKIHPAVKLLSAV